MVGRLPFIFERQTSNHATRVGGQWHATGMPRICEFDRRALASLLSRQHGVISRAQAMACGLGAEGIRYRLRVAGPWQRLLPGVYLTHTGQPSADQREMAALLHAGSQGILTGNAALRRFDLAAPLAPGVDVLLPATSRKRDAVFVRIHRTARLPRGFCVAGEIRYALPSRAVADAARGLTRLSDVRALVAAAVQQGTCPLEVLAEEVNHGPVRGSALLRQAMAEVRVGVRSPAEGDLKDLIKWARLPVPMFNPRLFLGRAFLASPDCWWPDSGVAAEVDSRAWHLSPRDWENTLARHARMSAVGIIVLHFPPRQIRAQRSSVAATIRSALAAGRGRPLPALRVVPAS